MFCKIFPCLCKKKKVKEEQSVPPEEAETMERKKYFTHKKHVRLDDVMELSPLLLKLFANFVLFCHERELPVNITSAIDDRVERISSTHIEGRALDISVRGWNKESIQEAIRYFNTEFADIGAISYSDGKSRALVYHNSGYGDHIHLQVRRL